MNDLLPGEGATWQDVLDPDHPAQWWLGLGDCLDFLPDLPAGSVDAVVTDPPYIIGGVHSGNAKLTVGSWNNMMNAARWFSDWYGASRRLMTGRAFFATFANWRTIPVVQRALSLNGWECTSVLVWDKEWIGPGGQRGLRPQWECVILAAGEHAAIADRGIPDVWRHKWMAGHNSEYGHPAEKPVDLMARLIRVLLPMSGGVVCDPFAGSGTTGAACMREGARFVGIEADDGYHAIARARLGREYGARQPALFDMADSEAVSA